jgi:hypothetical protein
LIQDVLKTSITSLLLGALMLGTLIPVHAQNVRREYWLGIGGSAITDLTSSPSYPGNPSGVDFPTLFEGPVNWADSYGSRIRGYVHPPVTGEYIFYIASDDQGQLFLSPDEYPASKQLIATEPQWGASRDWTGTNRRPNRENISAPVYLEAGRKYYIETLQKEGGGGDHVAVAWQLPGGALEGPIPGSRLSPFLVSMDPPEIVQQPADLSVPEGLRAEFRVIATGAEPLNFRWQRDGQDMIGQIFPNLIIDPVSLDDDGALFRCFISNPLGDTNTVTVTLTVTPETVPPVVVALTPPANSVVRQFTQVEVFFSEPVIGVDAADLRINGVAAGGLTGSGAGPYRFSFTSPAPGLVNLAWAAGHGITDLSQAVNPFAGGSWQVNLNPAAQLPDVVINEFLASNISGLTDEDGERGDWIELHNRGSTSANLTGWALTDDERYPGQWLLPEVTLPAGGYLLIFASAKDRRDPAGPLHASFQLGRAGEFLGLFNHELPRAGMDVFSPGYPEQRGDHSFGRDSSGEWRYFATPTPGAANGDSTISGLTPVPSFSAGRGFYDQPFNLHLGAEAGATIRYTVNGSEPTSATGTLYTGPIPISTTTTLRAVAFSPGKLHSVTRTHTYLLNTSPAIRSLPTLSLVTATENLWGPTGIMETNPRNTVNRGLAWERPVSAELIRPEDNGGFALDAGLRVQGGGYVRDRYDPNGSLPFSKYSFRLYFRGDYGESRLKYPFFPDVPFDEFERVSLRAGMNDHSNPFIVDELVRRLHGDMGQVASHGTIANLFLNGEYKGYYNPTERIDADFLRSWYGGTNDWDLMAQFGEVREGDSVKWNEMLSLINGQDMAVANAYAAAGAVLNLVNFIDYLLVNVYAGTGDWPHNNWRAARPRVPGGKFTFIVWDAEWAMGNAGRNVNINNLTGELAGSSEIARLFRSLLASPEFRMRFADRVQRHLFNGGALTDARIAARYWDLRNQMAGVLPGMNSYIHNTFIPGRRAVILNQLAGFGLQASGHAPVFNQHGGRIPDGFNLSMSAPRGTIHYTLDGTDPRLPADGASTEYPLVIRTAPKRALVPSAANGGSALGDQWKGGSEPFNAAAWLVANSGIGYDTEPTYRPHFDLDLQSQMLGINGTAYLRIPFNISGVNLAELNQLSLNVQFDDGFVAYLNGVEVLAVNAPGTRAWNSLATAGNPDSSAVNFQAFNISQHLGLLRNGANVLAIHALNVAVNSTDFLCNAELTGRTIVAGEVAPLAHTYTAPFALNQPVTVKARALDGGEWSALTEATFTPNQLGLPLRITELMYNPVGGDAYEFLELHNYGFAPVNVAGFSFQGINFIFPSGASIPGGATIVLASNENPALFAARYPGLAVTGYFGGMLSNSGERIALLDAAGNVVTSVTYSDGGTWPKSADGAGFSLVLVDTLTDPNQSAAWRASATIGGNPGLQVPPPAPPAVRINELMADNTNSVPHEGTFPDWVELHNAGGSPVNLAGWSLTDNSDPRQFVFPGGTTIAANGYLVVWCDSATTSGLHAGFALSRSGETVQLYDANTNLVDAVSFGYQLSDFTLGRVNGTADSWQLNTPTPGAANNAATLAPASALVINEWLAQPLPGNLPWLELHNSHATLPVSLTGLHLGNGRALHRARSRSFLPPGGFVRWFANPLAAGTEVIELALSPANGVIQLYDATGELVQTVNYGNQSAGVSQGRLPDGAANIVSFPNSASPGASNYLLQWTGPVLNEFLAVNNGVVTMANGRAADWLELRNPGGAPFDLTGMSLSIGSAAPGQWSFPAGLTIPAGGHRVVWCDSGLPATTTLVAELNTGRSLSRRGEAIYLFNAQGQLVDSVVFGPQLVDVSVGRDGSLWRLKSTPTPGLLNSANLATGSLNGLRINEWQATQTSGDDWIELHNTGTAPVVLDGSHLTDDPSIAGKTKFRFGPNSFIAGGGWLLLIADANPDNGADHVSFSLAAAGEHVLLYDPALSLIDGIDFGPQVPNTSAGRFPDGAANFVTFTTSLSPGDGNYLPLNNAQVNEVLAHTDPPLEDAIEFYNPTGAAVSIGGWFLSDSAANLKKFQIPAGTSLPANGYRVFYEYQFNGGTGSLEPFSLNSARGDSVYLSQADGSGNLTGYRAQASFGPSANGISFGRHVTSVGVDFVPLAQPTFGVANPTTLTQFRAGSGSANAYPLISPVVINEFMTAPPSHPHLSPGDGEFVELLNRSGSEVPLYDPAHPANRWRLTEAVEFTFPPGAFVPANGRALVVGFNPATNPAKLAAFAGHYDVPAGTTIFGPFSGRLSAAGETLRLERPDRPETAGPDIGLVPYLAVEHVSWQGIAPWPTTGLGAGASLQRFAAGDYANDPVNWRAGIPAAGNPNRVNPLDSDEDGLPDWWEITHQLNPLFAGDALLDSDDDGVNNLAEYRAGTNPRDAASCLLLDQVTRAPGFAQIGFRARAGITYEVQYRDAFGGGTWQKLTEIPAAYYARDTLVTDSLAPAGHRFYQLMIPAAP